MSYGLLCSENYLPWDPPLDCGPLAIRAAKSEVSISLSGQEICVLQKQQAKDFGLATTDTGLLALASRLARGSQKSGSIDQLSAGGKTLLIFSNRQEALQWLKRGYQQGLAWEAGLASLLHDN